MQWPHLSSLVLVLLLSTVAASAQEPPKGAEVTIAYPGETRPGPRAEIFAPGLVSNGDAHSRLAMAPNGRDVCWARFSERSGRRSAGIACISRSGGQWTSPYTPVFADGGMSANPLFSPDGTRLYFTFRSDGETAWNVYYAERTESGWGPRKSDGDLLNPTSSFTRSGHVYFCDQLAGKPWNRGIYVARLTADGPADATALPPVINSPYIDYTPFVAPDESFLMFSSSRPSSEERMFLVISFRTPEGSWSEPRRMHDALGYPGNARFPSISPDGKYLFFCGDDGNFYWADMAAVDQQAKLPSPPADHGEGQSTGVPVTGGLSRTLHSRILGEDRSVLIRLPAGYDDSDGSKVYPVLYQLDGEEAAFLRTVSAIDYLVNMTNRVPDYVVVGITNTNRHRDMDPAQRADRFLEFIKTELIPWVDGNYRTSGLRLLCGMSASSVFAVHSLLQEPLVGGIRPLVD